MKKSTPLLVALLWILATACTPSPPPPTPTPRVTITTPPTATPLLLSEEGDLTLTPEDVAYDARRLTDTVTGEVVAARAISGDGPSARAAPEHLRFSFTSVLSEGVEPRDAQLLIYPARDYATLYSDAGIDTVATEIERLRALVAQRPLTFDAPLPLLPRFDLQPSIQAHVEFVDFEGGAGVRYLSQINEGAAPVTNDGLFYTFQGLTHDGNYLVILFYPVRSAALEGMTSEDATAAADSASTDFERYRTETETLLTNEDVATFDPPLNDLDLLVSSLLIGNRGGGTGSSAGGGNGTSAAEATPTPLPAATGPTAVPNPTESSTGNTEVILLRPAVPAFAEEGQCEGMSLALARPNAWRCAVGDQLFDPCVVGSDGQTLVCDADPIEGTPGFALRLTAPLPTVEASPSNETTAWMIQLVTGVHCRFASGVTGLVGEQRINYVCTDQRIVLGDLQRDNGTWYAIRADVINNAGTFEATHESRDEIRRLWR
ncbi:MAG: hypothetical protein H6638_00390 [Ardenticatenales bacterium]|nr:hypothetical protein [Ardenticatenales bacterium]